MKQITSLLVILYCFATASNAIAETVSPEVSTVLLSSKFADVVADQNKIAGASGLGLRITDCTTTSFPGYAFGFGSAQIIVNCSVQSKLLADFQGEWTTYGEIVGFLVLGPLGDLSADLVYFK